MTEQQILQDEKSYDPHYNYSDKNNISFVLVNNNLSRFNILKKVKPK